MGLEEVFIDEKDAEKYFEELCSAVSKAICAGLITEDELDKAWNEWTSRNLM